MFLLKVIRIIAIVLAVITAPFLFFLVPYSLQFALLAYAIGHYLNIQAGTKKAPKATSLFSIITIIITIANMWTFYGLDDAFGSYTAGDPIPAYMFGWWAGFAISGLATIVLYIKSPSSI